MNHSNQQDIVSRKQAAFERELDCAAIPCRQTSEVEREAVRMNESMGMLDKLLEELRDRLRPALMPESPGGKHPAACGEISPGSEVGQLLRNTADHAASMRRQIDSIINRLAL